jgi:phosphatidylglycerol:prolipoprotein diacylglycerol transferase
MLVYPHIDPIAFSIGPFFGYGPLQVHWYGIMYLLGFVGGWLVARHRAKRPGSTWTPLDVDDLIFYSAMGVIFESLLNVFRIWDGGMSFHGGMTGVLIAGIIFARVKNKNVADVCDFLAPLPGIGLMTGRLGNFINGELWGKPTDLPWGFLVKDANGVATVRHPSQLYEAGLEGLLLFLVLYWFTSKPRPRLAPTGLFLVMYGCGRFVVEWVRLPDANIGYLAGNWLTMGMLLTTPMIFIGAGIMLYSYRRDTPSGNLSVARA